MKRIRLLLAALLAAISVFAVSGTVPLAGAAQQAQQAPATAQTALYPTPLNPWRYFNRWAGHDIGICVEDWTALEDGWSAYIHTAANAYNETPGVIVTYGRGFDWCGKVGYPNQQQVIVRLGPYTPCAWPAPGPRSTGGYYTGESYVYLRTDYSPCEVSNTKANRISSALGVIFGLKLYYGGTDYSVMNIGRPAGYPAIRWPTPHDTTNCSGDPYGRSGMTRRYNTDCT